MATMKRSYHVSTKHRSWQTEDSFDSYEQAIEYARERAIDGMTRITHMGLTLWQCDRSEVAL